MKNSLKIVLFVLLLCGVFGADEVKSVSVLEGEFLTLNPDPTQIKGFIKIQWRFGETLVAQTRGTERSYEDEVIFKDRLELNQTGSLTIKNMRTKHSGLYKLQISHNAGTSYQKFRVTVNESPFFIPGGDTEMKRVSVKEGDSVTLDLTEIHGDELIVWRFGDEGKLIAKHDIEAKSSSLYDSDERFRDRLQLNDQTGSLIITNTRTTDSGLYTVKISSNKQTLYKRFTVTVSVPGVSPAAVAGIVVVVLLVSAAAAGVMYFCRPRTTNLSSQTWSVPVGDDVTLNPETEIQTGDEIQWLFGAEDTLIAQIRRETREMTTYLGPDEIFMYRLKLDETTGSLTIEFIRTKHSGLYTLKIRRGRETLYKRFIVSVEERPIAVMEGDDVNLKPETKIQTGDDIQWLFENEDTLIAESKEKKTYRGPDGIFRDRLKLDETTGLLTITNTRTVHTALYILKIRRGRNILYKRFFVSVKERRIEVKKGNDVTINPDTEIQTGDQIQWLFRDVDVGTYTKAKFEGESREIITYDDDPDKIFTGRLELNKKTCSLTIKDTRTVHSGLYTLKIRKSRENLYKRVIVSVREEIAVMEGDDVNLKPETKIQTGDEIRWLFGDEEQQTVIAELTGQNGKTITYDDGLGLDETTGSLTIQNTRTAHSGRYTLEIRFSSGVLNQTFFVTVSGNRLNESATVVMALLNGEDVDEVNEEEGTSSL